MTIGERYRIDHNFISNHNVFKIIEMLQYIYLLS